jgi:hypothetical protein
MFSIPLFLIFLFYFYLSFSFCLKFFFSFIHKLFFFKSLLFPSSFSFSSLFLSTSSILLSFCSLFPRFKLSSFFSSSYLPMFLSLSLPLRVLRFFYHFSGSIFPILSSFFHPRPSIPNYMIIHFS